MTGVELILGMFDAVSSSVKEQSEVKALCTVVILWTEGRVGWMEDEDVRDRVERSDKYEAESW